MSAPLTSERLAEIKRRSDALLADYGPFRAPEWAHERADLVAEVERLRTELDEWRNREHQREYVLVGPDSDPNDADPVSQRAADLALERPDLGTPWVRTVSTGPWELYKPAGSPS
jgi:hypothetical protein